MHFLGRCVPLSAAACVSVLLGSITPASAQVVIFAEEVGPDVVFTVSGSFDPGTPDATSTLAPETWLDPSTGDFEAWQTSSDMNQFSLNEAVPFGTGLVKENIGIGTGDNFGIFGSNLNLNATYTAGLPINTTLTFAGTTFAALGVDVSGGPYVWTLAGNGATITLEFPELPEPAPAVDNSALKKSLSKKIKKLKKKAKLAKGKGQSGKAKRLLKKVKKLQKMLKALG